MPPSLTDKKSTVQKRLAHVCSAVVSAQALDMVSLCPECTASYSAPVPQEVDILSNCFILARIIKKNLAAMWKLLQRREPRQRKTEAQASVSQYEEWFVKPQDRTCATAKGAGHREHPKKKILWMRLAIGKDHHWSLDGPMISMIALCKS